VSFASKKRVCNNIGRIWKSKQDPGWGEDWGQWVTCCGGCSLLRWMLCVGGESTKKKKYEKRIKN